MCSCFQSRKQLYNYKCLSVSLSQKPLCLSESLLLTIKPIDHWAYGPLSLSTIEPIDHQAYWPSSLSTIMPINHWAYKPLCLSTIGPIEPIDHWAYWPSSLLTIKPIDHQAYGPSSPLTIKSINLWSSFATFKPFGLLVRAWTYIHIYYKKLGLISCNWP